MTNKVQSWMINNCLARLWGRLSSLPYLIEAFQSTILDAASKAYTTINHGNGQLFLRSPSPISAEVFGNTIVKVDPFPASLLTVIWPLWSWTMP